MTPRSALSQKRTSERIFVMNMTVFTCLPLFALSARRVRFS